MVDFDDLEDREAKTRFLRDLLGPIVQQYGGTLKHDADDDKLHCRGRCGNHPLQVAMDTSTGGLAIELKIRNTVGLLVISYDPDAEPPADEPDAEWDEGEERRHFIAPGFYLEEYPERLKAQMKVLDSLDPAEVGRLTALMAKLGVSWVSAGEATLGCMLFESLFDASAIAGLVDALHRFAAHFEKEGVSIAEASTPYEEDAAPVVRCRACGQNATPGKSLKCPNCGAGL